MSIRVGNESYCSVNNLSSMGREGVLCLLILLCHIIIIIIINCHHQSRSKVKDEGVQFCQFHSRDEKLMIPDPCCDNHGNQSKSKQNLRDGFIQVSRGSQSIKSQCVIFQNSEENNKQQQHHHASSSLSSSRDIESCAESRSRAFWNQKINSQELWKRLT